MKIGIGLPNVVPGTGGQTLVEWARRAEERGFSGLATIDRIAYPNYDSLVTLAAAAGATTRIELLTNILLAPMYPAAVLAKSAASLDQLSGGRFTMGVAPGGRADDFAAVGRDMSTRGQDLDAALDLMHRAWRGETVAGSPLPICPIPVNGERVPVLAGGASEASVRRAVTWGAGYTIGGSGADQAAPMFTRVRTAWKDAGREGEPRLAALAYFSLGTDAEEGLGPICGTTTRSSGHTPSTSSRAPCARRRPSRAPSRPSRTRAARSSTSTRPRPRSASSIALPTWCSDLVDYIVVGAWLRAGGPLPPITEDWLAQESLA